ncbi:MAG TPA: HPP family protein [Halococcus sp.]|nr:HPP family protein [Halococcus sp.]
MVRDDISQTITVGIHFVVLGLLTWATASPFLFPSLGPSAYLLAAGEGESERASAPYHVIGGHLVAVISGFIAFHLLAPNVVITNVLSASSPASSVTLLRLAASSVAAMMGTTFFMLVTDTNHPAACATTLIVSLGVLSSLSEVAYIMLAVVVLVAINGAVYPAMKKLHLEPEEPR